MFPELKKRYIDSGKIRYVFRDFPLAFHEQARPAATIANCAAAQGKYWEMSEALFANNRAFSEPMFLSLVQDLSLDQERLAECAATAEIANEIDDDVQYGESIGIGGTPTFYIGIEIDGQLVDAVEIVGAQPLSSFAREIDALL